MASAPTSAAATERGVLSDKHLDPTAHGLQTSFPFMRLPAELRRLVYKFAIDEVKCISDDLFVDDCDFVHRHAQVELDFEQLDFRGLTQSSHDVRLEFRPLYLAERVALVRLEDVHSYLQTFYPNQASTKQKGHLVVIVRPMDYSAVYPKHWNIDYDLISVGVPRMAGVLNSFNLIPLLKFCYIKQNIQVDFSEGAEEMEEGSAFVLNSAIVSNEEAWRAAIEDDLTEMYINHCSVFSMQEIISFTLRFTKGTHGDCIHVGKNASKAKKAAPKKYAQDLGLEEADFPNASVVCRFEEAN